MSHSKKNTYILLHIGKKYLLSTCSLDATFLQHQICSLTSDGANIDGAKHSGAGRGRTEQN